MSKINELRERQARIVTNAQAKLAEITDDMEEARASEIEREFDRMMADHDKIGKQIEREERLDAAQAAIEAPERRGPYRTDAATDPESQRDKGVTYGDAFAAYLRARGEEGLLTSEERAVLRRGYAEMELRAQTTTDAAGGYTVPDTLAARLIKTMAAWGPMYDPGITGEIVTTGGGPITMPTVNDTASTIEVHAEGVTLTDDGGKDVTFGEVVLNAYAYNTEWLRVSKELVDDSVLNMEAVLADLLGERLARRANAELTTGTGTNAPRGIVTASAQGKVAASQTALTIEELMDLEHSVDPAYRGSSDVVYMFNDATLNALRKLKDGDGNFLWQMGNVAAGQPATLNGRRYVINQAMPNIAAGARPVIFGAMSKYMVRKVGAPMVGAIQDKDFFPGFGIVGYIRFDGELLDGAAVKHLAMAAA